MKKLLLTVAALAAAINMQAQGYVNFATAAPGGVSAPATNVLTGARASGPAYLAQLYYGAAGVTDDSALVSVQPAPVAVGTSGFVTAGGRFTDASIVAGGAVGSFQVRIWEASLGATWEAALAAAASATTKVLGKSRIVQVTTANGGATPLPTPANLVGLTWFLLTPVPEPSTIALGAIGLGALLMLRRRK